MLCCPTLLTINLLALDYHQTSLVFGKIDCISKCLTSTFPLPYSSLTIYIHLGLCSEHMNEGILFLLCRAD